MGVFRTTAMAKAIHAALYLAAAGIAAPTWAIEYVDSDRAIDSSTPSEDYIVQNGATLLGTDATLNRVLVNASQLDLTGGQVLVNGVQAAGASTVRLQNVAVQGVGFGLALNGGAYASVVGGSLVGNAGLVAGSGAGAVLDGVVIEGTGTDGVQVADATLAFNGGRITGADYGVLAVENAPGRAPGSVYLSGTEVIGRNAAAIGIGGDGLVGQADVVVDNGTVLRGANDSLIDVYAGSEGTVTAYRSTLDGNVSVGDNATLAMTVGEGASLVGDYTAADSATASLTVTNGGQFTGALQNVADVTLRDGGTWNLVADATQQNLTLAGGTVRLSQAGSAFHTLSVENLSGSGQFDLRTDFASGASDFLDVTGTSSGSHVLNVASSGSDAAAERVEVARTADGQATFSLLNGRVDLGAWSYNLASDNGKDWYLDGENTTVSPGAASAMALFNVAPTVWYGELTTLRSRMGELRLGGNAATGAWVRTYGSQYNVDNGSAGGYRQQQQGLSLGVDTPLPWGDGQWLGGVFAGYSNNDLDLQRGTTGEVKSYYAGAYTTWLDHATGYYVDAVAKVNRLRNQADVALSDGTRAKGDYSSVGVGASAEFGRHIGLGQGWFVEPYTQLSTLWVQGRSFDFDNGLAADGAAARSVLAKAGTTVGRTLEWGNGRQVQPYVRVALAHEFANDNAVKVNGNRFHNGLAGSRGEAGAGVAVNVNSALQVHADFDYSNGHGIEQPWGASVGLRYTW